MTIIKPGTNLDEAARILRDVVQIFVDDPTSFEDTEKVLSLKEDFKRITTKCGHSRIVNWPLNCSEGRVFQMAIEYGKSVAYDGKDKFYNGNAKYALHLRSSLALRYLLNVWHDFVDDCDRVLYSMESADEHSKTAK